MPPPQYQLWKLLLLFAATSLIAAMYARELSRRSRMDSARTTESRMMEAFRMLSAKMDNGENISDLQYAALPDDGWGSMLKLVEKDGLYWIVSAGPDKKLDTLDDRLFLLPTSSGARANGKPEQRGQASLN